MERRVVSIGCGFRFTDRKEKNFIGIDSKDYGQHYVRDLRRGLPFDDDSVDKIIANSVLEHIPFGEHFGTEDYVFVMNECLRVLKKGGRMTLIVPVGGGYSFFKDPTHHRGFTLSSFKYLWPSSKWEYGFVKGWKENYCKYLDPVAEDTIEAELEKL